MKNLAALFIALLSLAACSTTPDRAGTIDLMVEDAGVTAEQAACVYDGLNEKFGEDDANFLMFDADTDEDVEARGLDSDDAAAVFVSCLS